MNLAKNALQLATTPQPSAYSIYKRIANLALAIIAVVICINLWLLSTQQAQIWHDKQANQLGRSLTQLGARVLANAVANDDKELVSRQLEQIVSDPHVANAVLFSHRGQVLQSTEASLSLLTNYRLRENMPLVFVEEIHFDDQIRGYLRLLLNEEEVMYYHEEYQRQIVEQVLVLMLLAGATGLLIARAFYKFRYRHLRKRAKEKTSS